jgi:hypothetical protein
MKMPNGSANQTQIVVALIAAFSALVLAVFQYLTQRKNTRVLEELKASLDRDKTEHAEYLKAYLNLLIEGKEQRFQAFKLLLQHLQAIRDKIRRVLSQPESYSKNLLRQELGDAVEQVVRAYSENQIHLVDDDRHLAHSIKNRCLMISEEFVRYASLPKGSPEVRTILESIAVHEKALGEMQAALRASAIRANEALVDSFRNHTASHLDTRQ